MSHEDMRVAANMIRAMRLASPVPNALPGLPILRLAALGLKDELPEVVRRRDARRLVACGLQPAHASALFRAFPHADNLEVAAALLMRGLPQGLVRKAVDAWGTEAVPKLDVDPYRAVFELQGDKADADAVVPADRRPAGAVAWELLKAGRAGHTVIALGPMRLALCASLPAEHAERVLAPFKVSDDHLADPETRAMETRIATEIKRRVSRRHLELDVAGLSRELTDEQRAAAGSVCASALSVLTGGPGTGKTTLVRCLVEAVGPRRCMLVAPTGRAARNAGGTTVHSASATAKMNSKTGNGCSRRPIQETSKADVPDDMALLIVDEASMLGIELMAAVLDLAPRECHVLLVGDVDQLPPVAKGGVLADLVRTAACPVVRLSHDHRCAVGVRAAAAAVLRGDPFWPDRAKATCEAADAPASSNAVRVMAAESRAASIRRVVELVAGATDAPGVLVPTNAMRFAFNRAIQAATLPGGGAPVEMRVEDFGVAAGARGTMKAGTDGKATLRFGSKTIDLPLDQALTLVRPPCGKDEHLCMGDTVMVTKNQNKKTLRAGEVSACNGDVGVLTRAARLGSSVHVVSYEDGTYAEFPKAEGWLTLGYAATVHKFQGSECDRVILVLDDACASQWDRHLLYTAITRAKTSVCLVGSRAAAGHAVARSRPERRTALRVLLR